MIKDGLQKINNRLQDTLLRLKTLPRRWIFIIGGILFGAVLVTTGFILWLVGSRPGLPRGSVGRFRDNPFTTGSVELKSCIRQAIGEQAFEAIAGGKRRPTVEESQAVEECSQRERLAERSPGKPLQVDLGLEERCIKEGLGDEFERVFLHGETPTVEQQKIIIECKIKYHQMLARAREEARERYLRRHPLAARQTMTFEVTVPENTPPEDSVYLTRLLTINPRGDMLSWKMEKVGPYKWRLTIPAADLGPDIENPEGGIYFYSRNGRDYVTAEALPGDPDPEFAEKEGFGRRMHWQAGTTQRDTVARWRWLPAPGEPPEKLPPLPEPTGWQRRIGGMKFRSGQNLEDLYYPHMEEFFDSTARHLRKRRYEWVVIAPSWDFVNEDPPKIALPETVWPNAVLQYPNDEMIKRHILTMKQAGLKVWFSPQVCCSLVDKTKQDLDWTRQFLTQLADMNLYYARLAQETGADAYTIETGLGDLRALQQMGGGLHPRWQNLLAQIREIYSGEVGVRFKIFGGIEEILAMAKSYPWIKDLDFFAYDMHAAVLSRSASPSDAELAAGAGRELDRAKIFFERFGKPIWATIFHGSVKESWKIGNLIEDLSLANLNPEKEVRQLGFAVSEADHARVVNAYFEAIKTRPWVIGLLSFSYSHMDMTRLPSADVRHKLAEDVWERWNRYLKTLRF